MPSFYNQIDEENFNLPDMGEYYDESLMEELLTSVDSKKPTDAAYYIEEPFTTQLGYNPEYEAFVIKGTPIISKYDKNGVTTGASFEEINMIDGDTVHIYLDSIVDNSSGFEINNTKYKDFKDYLLANTTMSGFQDNPYNVLGFNSNILTLRIIGIDAAEVPHYTIAAIKVKDKSKYIKSFRLEEITGDNFIKEVNKDRSSKSVYDFIKVGNTWHEISKSYGTDFPFKTSEQYDNLPVETKAKDIEYYKYVTKDEQSPTDLLPDGRNVGILAKSAVLKLLNSMTDIRIVVDALHLYTGTQHSHIYSEIRDGWVSDKSSWENMSTLWKQAFGDEIHKYRGFNIFGQDSYERFLGAIYVKCPDIAGDSWINAGKYVRAKVGDSVQLSPGISPRDVLYGNSISDAFKLYSYNNLHTVYADGFFNLSSNDFDDRRNIQREISGHDFNTLREYTVMIGDCLLMIPPTSIRVVNQIESLRVPLIRSKGAIVKEKPHTDRTIEMTLYFNGEYGINGVPIKRQTPSQEGTEEYTTYYMNGLRSLIAQFKYTPFLPIENEYINDVLGIEAVTLAGLQIATMPMYPKCLVATLTLQQFNYRVYLNELPVPDPDKGEHYNKNMFSSCINYGIMRYYYQRALQRGEDIKNLRADSQDYIEATMGNKVKLIPANFKDQSINFLILDDEWLEKLQQVNELSKKNAIEQTEPLNDKTVKWADGVGVAMGRIIKALNYYNGLKLKDDFDVELYRTLIESGDCPYLISAYKKGDYYNFRFSLDSLTISELNNLRLIVRKELDLTDENIFDNGVLQLSFKANDKGIAVFNKNTDSYRFAEFFAYRSNALADKDYVAPDDSDWDKFSTIKNEEYYELLKDNAIDRETFLSAKFKSYPTGNLTAQQFSITMANAVSNTKLKIHEGYAAQYMGGQDTILDFVFYTKDESTIAAMNAMQEKAVQQLIKYKEIITCWPIRIDSELTRLCGINEIIIESIDISTVPMQPGLYAIQCRAISVDRTMRNKEALEKLDAMNNAGAITPSTTGSVIYKTYFDLNNALSKAEVYPDLELPTLDELEATGYKFLKYMKNRNKRIYPDPDFYFIYNHIYSSQMVRKSIVDFFNKQRVNNQDTSLIEKTVTNFYDDNSGQEVDVTYDKNEADKVLHFSYLNPEREKDLKEQIALQEAKLEKSKAQGFKYNEELLTKTKNIKKAYKAYSQYESELLAISTPIWNVCTKIKCLLPESQLVLESSNAMKRPLKTNEDKITGYIDEILKKPIKASYKDKDSLEVDYTSYLRDKINKFIKKEFSKGTWSKIIELLAPNQNISENFKYIEALYEAGAIALSSNCEWSESTDKENYYAKSHIRSRVYDYPESNTPTSHGPRKVDYKIAIYPYCSIIDKNTGEAYNATSEEQAIKEGNSFGVYQIRKYEPLFLQGFYSDENNGFSKYDFLDPYYNKTLNPSVDQENYIKGLINSSEYSIEAFHRIVLVWIKKLISTHSFLSFFDIKREEIKSKISKLVDDMKAKEEEIKKKEKEEFMKSSEDENEWTTKYHAEQVYGYKKEFEKREAEDITALFEDISEELMNIVRSYDSSLILGKVFLPIICAVTHGDNTVYNKILTADEGALEVKTRSCQMGVSVSGDYTEGERNFRKYIRALAITGEKILSGLEAISSESQIPLEKAFAIKNQKLWLKASQDPSLWILHSYYDMVVNDKRGRMARAFPTYYMLFIDEGRKIGYWKLHDNFYNMNSIVEMEVVKSRKIATDTARITMTNLYKTFSTDDEDLKTDYTHNIKDVWNSIFSPSIYFEQEEAYRMNQMDINNVKLKAGARIHLRMGYSGDASELPIIFNGVVTEASTGELIEIVAQSDAHEIANNQVFAGVSADNAADLANESSGLKWIYNFFTEGATPKEIIRNILTTKSGFLGKLANKFTNGRFFNDSKFGIVHFGEIDFKTIHADGEVMQNIYEGEGRMPWQDPQDTVSTATKYAEAAAPVFTIELYDKSIWDVLNICAATSVEFITGIAPFGLRSTIFFGRPHYYYAYDYAMTDTGKIVEKRKPFQQYHIIDSYSDIITNNIRTSGANIKTVAVPLYKGPNWHNKSVEKKLEPLWADWDIYPEFQKTMVVNTGMQWKGNKLGFLGVNLGKNEWSKNGGAKIAWRMGAKALKDSFKDMYEGEVMIIGDTSIKPYDKIFLNDAYENMEGAVEVEAVVYSLNSTSGFTTSVFVDCISTVDNRYEELGSMWTSQIVAQVALAKSISYTFSTIFGTSTKPILNFIAKNINKGAYNLADTINKAAELADKEQLIKYSTMEDWSDKFYSVLNLSSSEVAVWNSIDRFGKWRMGLEAIDFSDQTTKNLVNILRTLNNAMDATKPENIAKALEDALKTNVKDKDKDSIEEAIKKLYEINKDLDLKVFTTLEQTSKSMLDITINQVSDIYKSGGLKSNEIEAYNKLVKLMEEAGDTITETDKMVQALNYAIELSDKVQPERSTSLIGSLKGCKEGLENAMKATDDVIETGKVASKITTSALTTAGVVSSCIWFAAEMVIMYILEKSIYNWIENKMASLNVLTVHPLKKNGSVYVAGIDGHKGLVIGSPTWNSKGVIDSFINWVFKDRNGLVGIFQDILFSDEMRAIAETYKKDNKLGIYANAKEQTTTGLLKSMAESEASSYSYYKALSIPKRILDPNSPNAHYTYKKTRIVCEIEDIANNNIIKNDFVIISPFNEVLMPYYDKNMLGVIHSAAENDYKYNQEGTVEKTNAIEFDTQGSINGKTIVHGIYMSNARVDIPAMRADAFQVFYRILQLTEEDMLNVKYGDGKRFKVWLKSGTIINDTSWSSTGYIFRISIENMDSSQIENILIKIQKELQDLFVNTEEVVNIMQWQKVEGNSTYEIFVAPRDEESKLNS